jgi:hypothetical protein
VFAVLGCGDIDWPAAPPEWAVPPICAAAPPPAGAECQPPAPALAEPGSGLSRPIWPGGGDEECHPPVEGEPAFGEFDGVTACHPAGPGAPGYGGELGAGGAPGGAWAPGMAPALPAPIIEPGGMAPALPGPVGCAPKALGGGAAVEGAVCQPPVFPPPGLPAVG